MYRKHGFLKRAVAVVGVVLALPAAHAQTPADPYSYSRTSAFTYNAKGLLESETVEPNQPQLCVTTTYTYDAYGNKSGATTANCTGASGLNLFDSRASSSTYAAQSVTVAGVSVAIPAGTFATSALNAKSHGESRVYDPRFGEVTQLNGPNLLATTWVLDTFGRKVLETRADATKSAVYFCWLKVYGPVTAYTWGMITATATNAPSNSPGCHNGSAPNLTLVPAPVAGEAPADAVRYEHSVPLNAAGTAAIGAFARVYFDRAGRKLRSVTQGFDPSGSSRLVVQDTDYNAYGTAFLSTQPYFLDSGSSNTTGANNYGMTLTEFDALGRSTASYTTDPVATGQSGGSVASWVFGSRGTRQAAVTRVTYTGLETRTTDDKGYVRREEKNPVGLTVRSTDPSGAQIVHQHDAFGNLLTTKDALGNQMVIAYDIRGRKVRLNDPDAGVTAYCYDALDQLKAQQTSAMRGSHTVAACPTNSGAGTTAPAVANWTTQAYDKLGRMTSRAEPEYTSTWTYDEYVDKTTCNKGVGKLCQTSTTHNVYRKLVYDNLGRPSSSRTDVTGGPSLTAALSYDANGRMATQLYPTGVRLSYQYTAKGFLKAVALDTAATISPLPATPGGTPGAAASLAAGTLLWQAVTINARGLPEQQTYANGVNNRAVFDAQTGRLTNLTAGAGTSTNVVDQRYSWNSLNWLTQRIDAIGDAGGIQVLDTFSYDSLGRLTQYAVSGGSASAPASRSVTLQYNALGMLLNKSDVGIYSYPAQGVANGKPHAVQSIIGAYNTSYGYDLSGNATTATGGKWRNVAYTSFNLPDGTNGLQGAAGTPKAGWQYDENHQRIKEVRVNASGTRTTWYLHPDNQGGLGFEREVAANGAQSNRHFISAGGKTIAVMVTTGALPTLAASQTAPTFISTVAAVKLEYLHKDQLGSLIATTDHAGAVTARYAYDPFGKRRYTNSTYDPFGNLIVDWTTNTNNGNDRGFTGHEHLDDLGVVHMNGRIFDPMIGRFMQADPLIQRPLNLQNFDRYTYCYNNPLICTDPGGFEADFTLPDQRVVITAPERMINVTVNYQLNILSSPIPGRVDFGFSGSRGGVNFNNNQRSILNSVKPNANDNFHRGQKGGIGGDKKQLSSSYDNVVGRSDLDMLVTSLEILPNGEIFHSYDQINGVCEISTTLCTEARVEAALRVFPAATLRRQSDLSSGELVWVGPGFIRVYPFDGGVLNVTTPVHIFDGGDGERGWVVRSIVSNGTILGIRSQGAGTNLSSWLGFVNNAVIINGFWKNTDNRIRDLVMDPNWKPR